MEDLAPDRDDDPRIDAIVFDFDGLVLETEEAIYIALKELWDEHGHELTVEMWAQSIGTNSADVFDAVAELNRLAGTDYTEESLIPRLRPRIRGLIEAGDLLPGVAEWLDDAEARGLGIGIASSSDREWVLGHLDRLGHTPRFPVVCCFDDVQAHKPRPDSYLEACRRLGVEPSFALALEDSVNGVRAAKAAGMWCVAVPTSMTRHLDFEAAGADLVVASLADVSFSDVVERLRPRG
ncbi:MAG TPA: HAD family phosphatase [Acidimicrobiales bacterium]|jgi:beta-phosphoglucomutase-like phosphatase (HAD superfamily)|nr:HAD family phosphatase [Acidimicrobiales bacterium]